MVTKPISQNVTVSAEDGSVRLLVNPDGSINVNTGGGTTADVNLAEVGGAAVTLGQKAMAASLPVAIASDQGTLPVVGNTASGVTDTGNPVKIGGVASSATPTTASDGQRKDAWLGPQGQVVTSEGAFTGVDGASNSLAASYTTTNANPRLAAIANYGFNNTTWDRLRSNTTGTIVIPPQGWQYAAASGGITNTTTAVTIKASAGAGLRNYVSSVQINTDALGTATELAIRDGAAGTVLWRQKLQTTTALPVTTITFTNPLVGSVATLLEVVTLTATVTGAVFFNAQGYVAP